MSILAAFGLFRAAKFHVALIMAAVQFLRVYSGIDLGLDEATVTAVIGGVGALLVWLVPNFGGNSGRFDTDYYPPAPKRPGLW